jgi:hypothetical protein
MATDMLSKVPVVLNDGSSAKLWISRKENILFM